MVRVYHKGKRGGRYYINDNGKKVYVKAEVAAAAPMAIAPVKPFTMTSNINIKKLRKTFPGTRPVLIYRHGNSSKYWFAYIKDDILHTVYGSTGEKRDYTQSHSTPNRILNKTLLQQLERLYIQKTKKGYIVLR